MNFVNQQQKPWCGAWILWEPRRTRSGSGSEFDSFTSNPISFRLCPSSSTHCHFSGFLQKLQCNLLYEVSCEVTAIGSCFGSGIFRQCNCCTLTVLGYVPWKTNTAVDWVTCQLLIQEVHIHVSSWGLAILTGIRGFSQSPQTNAGSVPQIMQLSLPPKYLPVH
jgi:hypothetical protein